MNLTTILADLLHLVITVPVLAVGVVIGAFGYRFLLKNDPTLLNTLINDAYTELQKVAAAATAKAATAPVPVKPAPAAPVATAAAPAAPAPSLLQTIESDIKKI